MIRKIYIPVIIAAILSMFALGCSEKEGLIEMSINDVSSRITNIPASVPLGDTMIISGTQLGDIERVIFGSVAIRKSDLITMTDTNISLVVPVTAALGITEVVLVFPGADRAFTSVTVVAP
jgi:hypothetical protein